MLFIFDLWELNASSLGNERVIILTLQGLVI